ncbi:54S ribosomal protein img2, mitochondrial [Beauveria bassiana]|uniref:Large ribosomal subunit protein mL49 n=1 Tax=Beauveria bassiana (strain ARSEF 2860) TaxID=655819 RepID=J4KQP8_BEAB2|nr:mitochondrial ribosomal protein subunit Img2 [Beauveria bassiana ARSEF 2860]EJP69579.1 mitochondrial ribosomal protein subunit Img2 [Beauveria bassiana ARSEF 2860]KAF1737388.1 54S ribosomal protein img2, mitochondrial [Beauveria bassiana]KAH8718400.1 54S ribosomal protein img2, mitochondrial [Beauveria bassiana]
MIARLSQSLPCVRAALLAVSPRQTLLPLHQTTSTLPLASSPCLLRNTYATAATAAAVARAAEKRSAPRSYTRAPTPPPTKTEPEQYKGSGYLVRRTASFQLPVYRKLKSGKTREVIIIKKVHGDRLRFLEDIKASLAVAPDRIRLNPTTQQIELQGDYYNKAKDWLVDNGF